MPRTLKEWANATYSVAKALLTGTDVGEERLQKRLEICSTCDRVQMDETGSMQCGICGCILKEKSLINLARFEETQEYGCKYPTGSKWKEKGV